MSDNLILDAIKLAKEAHKDAKPRQPNLLSWRQDTEGQPQHQDRGRYAPYYGRNKEVEDLQVVRAGKVPRPAQNTVGVRTSLQRASET
jgi:hypothetical protein